MIDEERLPEQCTARRLAQIFDLTKSVCTADFFAHRAKNLRFRMRR